MWRDAKKHRSPNAGWPESGFAAALNVRLSGPRYYDGKLTDDEWLHEEGEEPTSEDVFLGLKHYNRLLNWVTLLSIILLLFFWINKAGF